ncbi:hypothetical protein KQX54_018877 [Cotesia glomerata]|uniref:Uncharacterized protein n=1 Tax=Cotesia glomerata TaxID=32391 RepID=A0AAV7I285_COTGL|nr:hypothetical protein KQX54_018877 [Cotesia glomerata]
MEEIDNYKEFKKLKILGEKNYDEVCEEIKAGGLSKDVVLKIGVQYKYLFSQYHFNSVDIRDCLFPRTVAMSIIHVAIALNDQAMIDHLLALNCNLQATTGYGYSVLQFAVMCNKLTTVQKLLATGIDTNNLGEDLQLLLVTAVDSNNLEMVELLISRGAQVNVGKFCHINESPFGCAVAESNVKMMELLISHGADVNLMMSGITLARTGTPLMAACFFRDTMDSVELLLNHPYIDIQAVDNFAESCVFVAARNDHSDQLQLILNTNIDINTKNIGDELPLDIVSNDNNYLIKHHIVKLIVAGFYVCKENRVAVRDKKFDYLRAECSEEIQLMKNTEELYTNWSCFTILRRSQHFLALRFKHVEVSVDQEEGWIEKFPLYGKILAFHFKKALQRKMILKRTDQVLFDILYKILPDTIINNVREIDNYKEFKKLKIFGEKNYDEVCEEIKAGRLSKDVVLEIGVEYNYLFWQNDFNSVKIHDQPFRGIVAMSIIHIAIGLNDQAMIDHLLALKCDLQATTGYGNSVLEFAVKCNKLKTVQKLLDTGVDINDLGEDHQSLLTIAVSFNRYEMVELLLSRGAQVNDYKFGNFNMSPFGCAVEKSNLSIMELLISHGADVNLMMSGMTSLRKCTPLMVACTLKDSMDLIELLLDHPYIDIQAFNEINETCVFSAARTDPSGYLQLILNTNIDINTKNIYNKLPVNVILGHNFEFDMFGRIFLKYSIKRHIVKLIVAGFYVCEENREAVEDEKFDNLRAECSEEIQLMKNTKELSTNWSYFTILRSSQHTLALRFKHVEVSVDQVKGWIEKFPLYGEILAFHVKKALQRKMILERTDQVLFGIFNGILPSNFILDVCYFLSNYNLSMLLM